MKTNQAIKNFLEYHKTKSKKNTLRNYRYIFKHFEKKYGEKELESITSDDILSFLVTLTENSKQSTKNLRYSSLKAFFNFVQATLIPRLENPCNSPTLKNIFRYKRATQWPMIEKDVIDEIIFRTVDPRNRLMLELMARGGMRIGEVLELRPIDCEGCKLILSNTKSGREKEVAFIPQKVADRLKKYIQQHEISNSNEVYHVLKPLTIYI